MPIGIELQIYDPVLVPNEVWGLRLTINQIHFGSIIMRDVRLAARGVANWFGDSLTAQSFSAEHSVSRLSIRSQRQYLQ